MAYAGADWLRESLKIEPSEIGAKAADLLGDVFLGLYHLNQTSLKKGIWTNPHYAQVTYYGGLATVDFNELTRLVVLAHNRMLRVELEGLAPNYIRIRVHARASRTGGIASRCPTMEEHMRIINNHYDGKSRHAE